MLTTPLPLATTLHDRVLRLAVSVVYFGAMCALCHPAHAAHLLPKGQFPAVLEKRSTLSHIHLHRPFSHRRSPVQAAPETTTPTNTNLNGWGVPVP